MKYIVVPSERAASLVLPLPRVLASQSNAFDDEEAAVAAAEAQAADAPGKKFVVLAQIAEAGTAQPEKLALPVIVTRHK
jgi:hypothetical protein